MGRKCPDVEGRRIHVTWLPLCCYDGGHLMARTRDEENRSIRLMEFVWSLSNGVLVAEYLRKSDAQRDTFQTSTALCTFEYSTS